MIPQVNARDILQMSKENVRNLPRGDYNVVFEDGVTVKSHNRALLIDRYTWDILYLVDAPLVSSMSIATIVGDGYLNRMSFIRSAEITFKQICVTHCIRKFEDKLPLLERTVQISNEIYNEILHRISHMCTVLNAEDFVALVNHPKIKAIHSQLEETPDSIDRAYREMTNFVKNEEYDNPLMLTNRSGAANASQFNQCVGPRGFVTDFDRTVFKKPIFPGFIRGLTQLSELLPESRTAGIALNAAGDSIRRSEYASRRFQILTMVVERPIFGDCGSDMYMPVLVSEKLLTCLKGKWRLDEEKNVIIMMDGTEKFLIDTVIKVRSVFYCTLADSSCVCSTCAGALVENFPPKTNLGYLCSADRGEGVTQAILSTKHEIGSISSKALDLADKTLEYFTYNDLSYLFLKEDVKVDELYINLDNSKLDKLVDAITTDSSEIPMGKVGEIDYVIINNADDTVYENICLLSGDREAIITRDFLDHIRKSEYQVDARGNYIVPLKGWDVSNPIFEIPLKQADVTVYITKFSNLIEGTKYKKLSFMEHFFRLVDVVLERGTCNITILEIMAYAISVYNPEDNDYRLGRNSPELRFSDKTTIFHNRSMGQFLIYERQMDGLLKHPEVVFGLRKRQPSIVDVLFLPQETLNYYNKRVYPKLD